MISSVGSGCSDKIVWTMMVWLWLNNVFWYGSSSRVGRRQGFVCSRRVNSTVRSLGRLVRAYRIVCQMKYDSRNFCVPGRSDTQPLYDNRHVHHPAVASSGQYRPSETGCVGRIDSDHRSLAIPRLRFDINYCETCSVCW